MTTNKTTHTQAPWGYREDPETLTPRGEVAWQVYRPDCALREAAPISSVYRMNEVGEADARLIAAAPELLAVVKLEVGIYLNEAWAIEEVERIITDNEGRLGRNPGDVVEQMRRAAILRAEGGR